MRKLETVKKRFDEVKTAESDNRRLASADDKFAAGEQWSTEDKKEREGRPSLTVNKVNGTLKTLRGSQRQLTPAISVRPVDSSADPEVAEILGGLIKNIEYDSDASSAYNTAYDQAIEGGWGYFRITTEYSSDDTFDQDVKIRRVPNRFSVYMDQSYSNADASDAHDCFITEIIPKERFEKLYNPDGEKSIEAGEGEFESDWFTEDGVRVAEYFYKEPVTKKLFLLDTGDVLSLDQIEQEGLVFSEDGWTLVGDNIAYGIDQTRDVKTHKVMWCKFCGGKYLEEPREWAGKFIPIILIAGEEVYIDGKKTYVSAHRHAQDAQKVYNWMVSTAVETVAMAPKQPFLLTPKEIEGHEKQWAVSHRRPMPYLLHNPVPGLNRPQRQGGGIPDSGATQERMGAADDIKATTGVYDASVGAVSNETSGIAIQSRQSQGDMATYEYMDNLKRGLIYAGKVLIDLIPRIYDSERIVRVLGKDGSEKFVEINKTVVGDDNNYQTLNDLSQGKYDVVVEVGAAYNTQRQEAAANMVDLLRTLPQIAPNIIDLVIKNLDFPGASEIVARLQQSQAQQQPDPEQQLDMAKKQLDVEGKELNNAKDVQAILEKETLAQIEDQAEATIAKVLQRYGLKSDEKSAQR